MVTALLVRVFLFGRVFYSVTDAPVLMFVPSDVFLTCDDGSGNLTYQIWTNNKSAGFILARSGRLPSGTQSVSFADMGACCISQNVLKKGSQLTTLQIVTARLTLSFSPAPALTPVQASGMIAISISSTTNNYPFAQQKDPHLSAEVEVGARREGTAERLRTFVLRIRRLSLTLRGRLARFVCQSPKLSSEHSLKCASSTQTHQRISISSLFPTSSPQPSILVRDTSTSPSIPLALKLGDVNLDGFPDILLISALSSAHEYSPTLAISVGCGGGSGGSLVGDGASPAGSDRGAQSEGVKAKIAKPDAGCDENGQGKRGFRVLEKGASALRRVVDARGAAFIDIDEDVSFNCYITLVKLTALTHLSTGYARHHGSTKWQARTRNDVIRPE